MQRAGRGPLGGRGARTRRVDATAAATGTILVLVPLYHLGTNIIVVVTLGPTTSSASALSLARVSNNSSISETVL